MAEGRILILEGYDGKASDYYDVPKTRRGLHPSVVGLAGKRRGNKNSPAARAAKACRKLAKGKGIMAPKYRRCVKQYIKKHSRRSR